MVSNELAMAGGTKGTEMLPGEELPASAQGVTAGVESWTEAMAKQRIR